MGLGPVTLSAITARWQLFAVFLVMSTSASLSTTTIGAALLPWFTERRAQMLCIENLGDSAQPLARRVFGEDALHDLRLGLVDTAFHVAVHTEIPVAERPEASDVTRAGSSASSCRHR